MTATESGPEPSYPSERLTRVSTALPIDAAAVTPGKRKVSPLGIFREMPLTVKLSAMWLTFVVVGAIWAKIDGWVGGSLPLKDPFFQGVDFRTGERSALPNESPSAGHWLGTDILSRDTFARIVLGGWTSIIVAGTAAACGVIIGGFLGTFVGYVRGKTETVIMSIIDVILAFPALVLLLAMVSIFKVRNLFIIAIVIGLLSVPAYTRVARANTLAIANREFVHAAQAIGTKKFKILFREIIPNVLPTLLAYALVAAAFVIVVEGTLSFLGLSVQPPEPTWGNMINEGRKDIKQTIFPVLWPSLALSFTVLSLNQVGDWLQRRAAYRGSAL
jgi:peptide/nickel transport system permease protein